jgi:hypothetical protein
MTFLDYSKVIISRDLLHYIFHKVVVKDAGYKTPCWLRNADPKRYTILRLNGHNHLAHRVTYALFVQVPKTENHCDHLCRNPACCNPSHLEEVTPRENYMRGTSPMAENNKRTHCVNGHLLEGENVRIYTRKGTEQTRRSCKTCWGDRYQAKKRREGIPDLHINITHCSKGHELTPDNIYRRPNQTKLNCRICRRVYNKQYYSNEGAGHL